VSSAAKIESHLILVGESKSIEVSVASPSSQDDDDDKDFESFEAESFERGGLFPEGKGVRLVTSLGDRGSWATMPKAAAAAAACSALRGERS